MTASNVSAADILLSDILNSSAGFEPANTTRWLAQQFKTTAQSNRLSEVDLMMARSSGTGDSVVQTLSGNAGVPGAALATLVLSGSYSTDPAFTVTFATNTNYRVVLQGTTGNDFGWSWANTTRVMESGSARTGPRPTTAERTGRPGRTIRS